MVLSRLALGVLLLSAACGGDDDGGSGGDVDASPGADADLHPELSQVFPRVAHGGYDGSNDFFVPISTDLPNRVEGTVTWESDDESIVTVEAVDPPPDAPSARGTWAMLTTHGAGTTTVTATLDEYTVTAEIIIAAYTPEQVDTGDTRYHDEAGTGDRVACASCHEAPGGADHSPTQMAFHDDDAILLAATDGHYPDLCVTDAGDECTCDTEGCDTEPGYVLGLEHTWEFTVDEAAGIVPYLRSLPPRGF
jgi:hypothetical protein